MPWHQMMMLQNCLLQYCNWIGWTRLKPWPFTQDQPSSEAPPNQRVSVRYCLVRSVHSHSSGCQHGNNWNSMIVAAHKGANVQIV